LDKREIENRVNQPTRSFIIGSCRAALQLHLSSEKGEATNDETTITTKEQTK